MNSTQISYRKTIIGWVNVTLVETRVTYNVEPRQFQAITGANPKAVVGCTEINGEQLDEILTDRWTRTIGRAVAI